MDAYVQPLTVHSLVPPAAPQADPDQPASMTSQHMGPRHRLAHTVNFRALSYRRRPSQTVLNGAYPPVRGEPEEEIDRELVQGEEVRVAVVIRMPQEEGERRDEDGEDEVGWETGMELGVWEGVLGADEPNRRRSRVTRGTRSGGDEG